MRGRSTQNQVILASRNKKKSASKSYGKQNGKDRPKQRVTQLTKKGVRLLPGATGLATLAGAGESCRRAAAFPPLRPPRERCRPTACEQNRVKREKGRERKVSRRPFGMGTASGFGVGPSVGVVNSVWREQEGASGHRRIDRSCRNEQCSVLPRRGRRRGRWPAS